MNNDKLFPLIIIGGGGHASVLIELLREQKRTIIAIISPDDIYSRKIFTGIKRLASNEDILSYSPDEVRLVNGIGMMPNSSLRKDINQYFCDLGYQFETIISEHALVSDFASVQTGAQILKGAIVQVGAIIGKHSIINTGALVEHDTVIGDYNHIAPKAVLCGGVITQSEVYVGANATVLQNIQLAEKVIVGAGAIVTAHLVEEQICFPSRMAIKK